MDSENIFALGDLGFEPNRIQTEIAEEIKSLDVRSVDSAIATLSKFELQVEIESLKLDVNIR